MMRILIASHGEFAKGIKNSLEISRTRQINTLAAVGFFIASRT